MPDSPWAVRHCIIYGEYPLSLATLASSPKGTPLGYAGNFIATAKRKIPRSFRETTRDFLGGVGGI